MEDDRQERRKTLSALPTPKRDARIVGQAFSHGRKKDVIVVGKASRFQDTSVLKATRPANLPRLPEHADGTSAAPVAEPSLQARRKKTKQKGATSKASTSNGKARANKERHAGKRSVTKPRADSRRLMLERLLMPHFESTERSLVAEFVSRILKPNYVSKRPLYLNYVRSDGHVYEKMLLKACAGCVSEVSAQLAIREQLAAGRRLEAEQRNKERLRQLDEGRKKEEAHRKFLREASKERATVYGFNRSSEREPKQRMYIYGASFAQPTAAQSAGMPGNEESDPFDYWFKRQSWV